MIENDVMQFYDSFLESKMLSYRLYGNKRIDKAKDLILKLNNRNNIILDVGCGIGIIPEEISKNTSAKHIFGIDLSKKNIWYAKQTVKRKNISFFQIDIVKEFDKLKNYIGTKVDCITMIDVIEHIPENQRLIMLKNISNLMKNSGFLILTYPSPYYQKYLMLNNTDELQIIDNVIETGTLINEAELAGLKLHYCSFKSIYRKNDYVHVILEKENKNDGNKVIVDDKKSYFFGLLKKIYLKFVVPIRRRKYVTNIFKDK